MNELTELARRQLRMQKLIALLLAALIILLLAAGVVTAREVKQLTDSIDTAMEQLQEIDIESINEAVSGTKDMMESVNDFSEAVDNVTERVRDLDTWISGIFGN